MTENNFPNIVCIHLSNNLCRNRNLIGFGVVTVTTRTVKFTTFPKNKGALSFPVKEL